MAFLCAMSVIEARFGPRSDGTPKLIEMIVAALAFASRSVVNAPVTVGGDVPVSLFLAKAAADNAQRTILSDGFGRSVKDVQRVSAIMEKTLKKVSADGLEQCTEDAECMQGIHAVDTVLSSRKLVVLPKDKWIMKNNKHIFMQVAVFDPSTPEPFSQDSLVAFHGSAVHNWWSIIRNGIVNATDTKLMVNDAWRGPGAYFSTTLQESASLYALPNRKKLWDRLAKSSRDLPWWKREVRVVGVFEVPRASVKTQGARGSSGRPRVHVAPDESYSLQGHPTPCTTTTTRVLRLLRQKPTSECFCSLKSRAAWKSSGTGKRRSRPFLIRSRWTSWDTTQSLI